MLQICGNLFVAKKIATDYFATKCSASILFLPPLIRVSASAGP